MARGVTRLTKGMHKATTPIDRDDKFTSDDLALEQLRRDNAKTISTNQSKRSGTNSTFR